MRRRQEEKHKENQLVPDHIQEVQEGQSSSSSEEWRKAEPSKTKNVEKGKTEPKAENNKKAKAAGPEVRKRKNDTDITINK